MQGHASRNSSAALGVSDGPPDESLDLGGGEAGSQTVKSDDLFVPNRVNSAFVCFAVGTKVCFDAPRRGIAKGG
jgi:hypothetical protein